MLAGLWTIGVKVPDLEAELAFHRAAGNELVLDETLSIDGVDYRVPLVKMGDKYLHLAERMVYEVQMGIQQLFQSYQLEERVNTCRSLFPPTRTKRVIV